MNSVLIIDDDDDIRTNLREQIRGAGYHVFSASDGLEGLTTLRFIKPPAIIILDQKMPMMNAADFLRVKGRVKAWASIPVIVVSADALEVNSPDVVAYLPKPLNMNRLLAVIQKFDLHPSWPAYSKINQHC